jgi:hypothetical protein
MCPHSNALEKHQRCSLSTLFQTGKYKTNMTHFDLNSELRSFVLAGGFVLSAFGVALAAAAILDKRYGLCRPATPGGESQLALIGFTLGAVNTAMIASSFL